MVLSTQVAVLHTSCFCEVRSKGRVSPLFPKSFEKWAMACWSSLEWEELLPLCLLCSDPCPDLTQGVLCEAFLLQSKRTAFPWNGSKQNLVKENQCVLW